jgi:proteasome accessory factor B
MKSANRPALLRFARIDEKIRSGSWPNAPSLAGELEVAPRTIHRDVEFLRDQFHAPIAFDTRKNGYYYSNPSFRLPYFQVSEGECIASAWPAPTWATASPSNSCTGPSVTAGSWRSPTGPPRATGRRLVDPYHLASIDGDWYLIAYCHRRQDVLMFSPARIRAVKETGQTFERPADFCIGKYLDVGFRKLRGTGPPQTVRLRFSAPAARYVREKTWHPTQKLRRHADGTLTLTFRVDHLLEVKRWVLSFGADCEVLGPKELQKQVAAEVAKMMDALLSLPLFSRQINHRTDIV